VSIVGVIGTIRSTFLRFGALSNHCHSFFIEAESSLAKGVSELLGTTHWVWSLLSNASGAAYFFSAGWISHLSEAASTLVAAWSVKEVAAAG
jgi:hypothetical protein